MRALGAPVARRPPGAALSRDQLGAILAAVGDGVTVQDPSGVVIFANAPALRLLGMEPDATDLPIEPAALMARFEVFDATGSPLPADDLPGRRALRGEPSGEIVLRFRVVATGEERWARVSASAVPGPDGRPELAVNTFRDITARLQGERQTRFEAGLLDAVEASVVAIDRDGRVSHWNRAAERLFGRRRDQAMGRRLAEVAPALVERGTGRPEPRRLDLDAILAGASWAGELRLPGPDGSLPVYVSVNPIRDGAEGSGGSAAGFVIVAIDVSERQRAEANLRISEARYRTLAESLPHVVWTARSDGHVDHLNERYASYTGLPDEVSRGWGWTIAVHPDDLPGLYERWTEALRSGRDFEAEYRLRRHDGVYRWHVMRVLPLEAADGSIAAWIGSSTDIDDRKRAEQSLAFLADASRVLNDSLDYERTLAAVADLAVPRIADWCRVDLVDQAGRNELVAIAHVDPARVGLARELDARLPIDPAADTGIGRVLRTGQPELIEDISPELLEATVPDPQLRGILGDLGLRSSMVVPLLAEGRPIGAISLVAAESGRRFDASDLALAEDLAGRAATAIEHAQLYRRVSQFKAALDNATDCVFMYDPATLRFTYVNRGATEQVGYGADELLRLTPLDLKPEFDEASYRALIEPLVRGELAATTFHTLQRRRDGRVFPVDVTLQRIELEPDGTRIIAFVRDATERVETQARLRRLAQAERMRSAEVDAVVRAIGEAVVVCDADGSIRLSNPAARKLLGAAARRAYADILKLFEDGAERAPRLGLDQPQGPTELRLHDRRRWLELTAYPVLVEAGEIEDLAPAIHTAVTIVVMRDVTGRREQETMREAFVGVLSHELRTPVTTIYGNAKVLTKLGGRLNESSRTEVFKDIEAEADRLFRLVEDLLVLARFNDEPVEIGDEPVLLQRVVPQMVAAEQARWPLTHFVAEIPVGLPTVRADPTYVEQVTRNLLGNGAKYGPPGGTVSLRLEPGDHEVRVLVRDEGPGFPPEEADRLFELFYRSPLTAGQATGAGIGLFVCRRLIEAMGGRIWARSLDEGGAEFGFTLRTFEEDE